MTSVRVLSYNVRSLRDDVASVSRVIRSIEPDVAIIQEAPRFFGWRSKCAALARSVDMALVCGGRRTGANLVLAQRSVDVVLTREVRFSPYRNLHRRGSAVARVRVGEADFVIAGTHLDLIEVPRLRHLDELRRTRDVLGSEVPFIVGGDINAVPGSATWLALESFGADAWPAVGVGDGFTYPSDGAVRRIDALFVPRACTIVRASVPDNDDVHRASDHRPLVVDLEF